MSILIFGGIVFALLILWNIWGFTASRVEQAEYTVETKANGYEIRRYAPHIRAQTTVSGNYDTALNEGFRIVAGYIFGGNTARKSVAMTAPVIAQKHSEKIAMTSPVIAKKQGDTRVVSFVMPKSYTLDSLPIPNDARVSLVEMPEKRMAVLTFSWCRSTARVQTMEKKLLAMLKRDSVALLGEPAFAGYNAPFTPPWLMRNEVMVELA